MIRHLRSNLIAYLALFLALGGGSFAVAALNRQDKRVIKKIVNRQITKRAGGLTVNHARTANEAIHAANADSATSANSAVSAQSAITAQSANSADSVGGVSFEPVRIALPDGAPDADIVSVDGSFVSVSNCGSGDVTLRWGQTATVSSQLATELIVPGAATSGLMAPNNSISQNDPVLGLTASIRQASGRVTRVSIIGFYAANAFGGTDDCFVQGTIERFG